MICKNCGQEIEDSLSVCPKCGYDFSLKEKEAEETALEEVTEEEAEAETVQEEEPAEAEVKPEETAEEVTEASEEETAEPAEEESEEPVPEETETESEAEEESVPEETLETEVTEKAVKSAPVKEEKREWFRYFCYALLGVLSVIAIIAFLYETSPLTQYRRTIADAEAALASHEYEEAIVQYQKAGTYPVDHEDLSETVRSVYDAWAKENEGKNDYEAAIAVYEKAIAEFPKNAMEYDTKIVGNYVSWANYVAKLKEYSPESKEEADAILFDAKIKGYSVDDAIEALDARYQYQENMREIEDLANSIARALDNGNTEEAMGYLRMAQSQLSGNDFYAEEHELSRSYPYVVEVKRRNKPYVAFYPYAAEGELRETYLAYYGNLVENQRQGSATVLISIFKAESYEYIDDIYTAEWVNDLPQGELTEEKTVRKGVFDSNDVTFYRISGRLKDSYYDGEIVFTDKENISYTAQFARGMASLYKITDPLAEGRNVIAVNEDKTKWIIYTEEELHSPQGVKRGVIPEVNQ
ncbi:MAG: zinc ribbon domain-containing protein [Erysipelotrichaceae bacterium]|nr:zinc ribbon domain-containing protein [Erysipelotrichaceae bacterium]